MKTEYTPTPKSELMFKKISERTNFHELVERPEWNEIKKMIVCAVNSHEALLERLKTCADWINRAEHILTLDQRGYCGFLSSKLVRETIAQAESEI